MKSTTLPALNIQYPISQLILGGAKTIETRHYPLPKKYVGKPMLFVETPGRAGTFQARIVGVITFGESWLYESAKEFYSDSAKHRVTPKSEWAWKKEKPKWAWPIENLVKFDLPITAPRVRGIKFTKSLKVLIPSTQRHALDSQTAELQKS